MRERIQQSAVTPIWSRTHSASSFIFFPTIPAESARATVLFPEHLARRSFT